MPPLHVSGAERGVRLLRRRSRPSAQAQEPPPTSQAVSSGTATLILERRKNQLYARLARFRVMLDGVEVGEIGNGETCRFPIAPGKHKLQLLVAGASDPLKPTPLGHIHASRPADFTVGDEQTVSFICGPGPMSRLPMARVPDPERTPDLMLKPRPPRLTRRTWNRYE